MNKKPKFALIGLVVLVAGLLFGLAMPAGAQTTSPTLFTNKSDYAPGEVVYITGMNLPESPQDPAINPGTKYALPVMRPDGNIVVIDPLTHAVIPGYDSVYTDAAGNLAYNYQLNGIEGPYIARAYLSPWSGDWNETPAAEVTFTDASITALTVTKVAAPPTYTASGTSINYSYTVTNSGNEILSPPFTVTDTKATVTCSYPTSLAVGASFTCSASYTTLAADVTFGYVENMVTANGTFLPSNKPPVPVMDTDIEVASVPLDCLNDTGGANDDTGQKDLTRVCASPTAINPLVIAWNWDEILTTGNNTIDACSLFDSDGDGNANYAICASWLYDSQQTPTSPIRYSCDDDRPDRCNGSNALTIQYGTDCAIDLETDDPFLVGTAYPNDTKAYCSINWNDVGGITAELIDVCSYPSGQPSSAPSDCTLLATGNNATLEVIKDVVPDDSNSNWNITVTGPTVDGTLFTFTDVLVGDDSTGYRVVPTGVYTIVETAGAGANLADYNTTWVCTLNNTPNGSGTGTTATITLGKADLGECTFTNTRKIGSLKISKTLNDGGSGFTGDFTIHYDCGGTYAGDVTIAAGASATVPSIPAGSSCTVTEPTLPTAPTDYSWGSPGITGSPATIINDTTVEVTVANTLTFVPRATLSLLKQISTSATGPWSSSITVLGGSNVYYKFTVTNTGNVPLSPVSVTDLNVSTASCSFTDPLPVAGVTTCVVGPLTAQTLAGTYQNTATAHGDYVGATYDSLPSSAEYIITPIPSIDVEKYVSIDGKLSSDPTKTWVDADTATGPYLNAGTAPQFKFVVINTGNVDFSNVDVTDDVFGNISLDGTLAANASAEYFVTGAWSAGQHTNTATARGDFGGATYNDTDAANYFGSNPEIDVEKYVSIDGKLSSDPTKTWVDADTVTGPYLNSGTAPQFKFVVTNTGNVALSNVDVTDDIFLNINLDGTLAVGASATYYKTGVWAQGQHTNTATASGEFSDGNGATETDTDTDAANYFGSNPEIDVEKYVSIDGKLSSDPTKTWVDADTVTGPYLNSGTAPQFKFVVTNTGNVALSNVDVTDDIFLNINLDGTLAVGASATYYKTGTWAQGQHTNTATASGEFSDGNGATETDTDTDAANYFGSNPEIDVEKYVSIDGKLSSDPTKTWVDADTVTGPYLNSGTAPQFKFVVTNTGNVALSNVDVTDDIFLNINLDGTLAVGASATYYKTGTWAQGQHTNTATASGEFSDGNGATETDTDTDAANYFGSNPEIDVEKYVSIDGSATWVDADTATGPYLNSGTAPQFKFVVTNTGNVALSNVDVTDDIFLNINLDSTLAVGASATYYKTGTWAQGQHTNTATASGEFSDGNGATETDTDTDAANYFGSNPEIDVEKSVSIDSGTTWVDADTATGPYLNSGTAPQFKFVVTNTGNVDLSNVDVTDDAFGNINLDGTLAVGASATYYKTGTWAQGQHTNTATASGEFSDGNGATETDTDTDAANYFGANPQIAIVKVTVDGATSGDGLNILSGESIKWRNTVTNAGNIPLSNVSVTDSKTGVTPAYVSGDTNDDDMLDLTEIWIYEASSTAIAGSYSNTGTAYGDFTDSNGDKRSDSATDGSSYFGADPQIAIVKVTVDGATSGDGLNILTGEAVTWRYTVTNVGNVPLTVTVTDSKTGVTPTYLSGDTISNGKLDLTETWVYTASGTAIAGSYSNTGTANGSYTDSASHSRTDTATDGSSYFGANPQIDIVKKTVGSDGSEGDNAFVLAGATVTWKYYVTNSGNVALSSVSVTDSKGVAVTCPKATLAVSESMICTASGTNNTPAGTWYSNTGTATAGPYTDSAGHSRTTTDTDASGYYSSSPGLVTNSSLCDFGTNFTLVFTPDMRNYTSALQAYKLSDSNPGQFFYNVFQTGGSGSVSLTLPYPFVTQGATPIHVYSGLTANTSNGQNCLQPTGEIKNYQTQVTLGSYGTNPAYSATKTVTLTGLPTSGFMYINIHLDYGLEKLNGWEKKTSSLNAYYTLSINPSMPKVNILNNTQHTFTSTILNSSDSISNTNEFKKVKGVGGLAIVKIGMVDGVAVYAPVQGAKLRLYNPKGVFIEEMTSDQDGWYLSNYVHNGKDAIYTVVLVAGSFSGPDPTGCYGSLIVKTNIVGKAIKFGEANFNVIPTSACPGMPDTPATVSETTVWEIYLPKISKSP